jgi:tricorn protease
MKRVLLLTSSLLVSAIAFSQINAKLFRDPDVSATQICFVYGGDVWIVPKTGGTAFRLTSSNSEKSFPRFSPDGKTIAFSAIFDGNMDVYAMPVIGGIPARLTWCPILAGFPKNCRFPMES